MNFLEKRLSKKHDKKAKEDFDKYAKGRADDHGEPYRWTGDARVLWPDDKVTHYRTFKGAQRALKRKGYERWCFGNKDKYAIIVTDVWAERWYK